VKSIMHLIFSQGLSSSFFFALGGVGLILLEVGRNASGKSSKAWLIAGGICVGFAFLMLRVFIKMKIPNYLVSTE